MNIIFVPFGHVGMNFLNKKLERRKSMGSVTRSEIEDFLYLESALLDDWKLEEWASLFTEDGFYLIPPTDKPDADHRTELFIISDNHHRIVHRAKRLLKKEAHVEYPHSRTRHCVNNV